MKTKTIFYLLITFFLAFPTSCDKDEKGEENPECDCETIKETEILVSFERDKNFVSAVSSDNTEEAEPWESKINNLIIYVFDDNGKFVLRRALTQNEINNMSARLRILTDNVIRPLYSFYAIANHLPVLNIVNENSFLQLMEDDIMAYQGEFKDVSNEEMHPGGFVMSACYKTSILTNINPYPLVLKRTVTKMTIQTEIESEFQQQFSQSRFLVLNATLHNTQKGTNIIENAGYRKNYGLWQITQSSFPAQETGKYLFNNLFYAFEADPMEQSSPTYISLEVALDEDGNETTTGDRTVRKFTFFPEFSGDGQILRNHYYKINVLIKSLASESFKSSKLSSNPNGEEQIIINWE